MLIISTDSFESAICDAAKYHWPGPKVLLILPGSFLQRKQIGQLNKDFIIIEHLQPPGSVAEMLCDMAGWLDIQLRQADWPLLFLGRPFDPGDLADQEKTCRTAVHGIKAEFSPDGQLTMLQLGEMVATNPLFPEFFRHLGHRSIDDATCVELLRTTFNWKDK